MKYGVCLPYMKPDFDKATMREWCRRVDEGPFDAIYCGERITGTSHEMTVLLSMAAAFTERVRIIPSLYVLPMHSAVWAAKQVATLDRMSGGRVTMCVGVGGRPKDYQSVGAPFERRWQRMDEQIAVMKSIWQGEPAFEGADPVGPGPAQVGGPPILLGAMGPKSTARGAQWADGVFSFSGGGNGDEIAHYFGMAREAWQAAGRASDPYLLGGFFVCLAAQNPEQTLRQYAYDYLVTNAGEDIAKAYADGMTGFSAEAVQASLDAYEAAGCQEIQFSTVIADVEEVDRLADIVRARQAR